jgi:hypothetical protein
MKNYLIYQDRFRPALPEIKAAKDFREKRAFYIHLDEVIRTLRLDEAFLRESVKAHPHRESEKFLRHSRNAFRCMLVKYLERLSMRDLSTRLSDSCLSQWFCFLEEFGQTSAPSKSALDRYAKWIDREALDRIIAALLLEVGGEAGAAAIGLESAYDLSEMWIDSTCLKAHIHYPTDWVLLIDATRTLMKACILIREQELKCRMPQPPEDFIRDMNKLGMSMSHLRGKRDTKRARKKQLRLMKKMVGRVRAHAQRHQVLLNTRWEESEWSEAQAAQVSNRIQGILDQLPEAQRQAEERILHGRQIPQNEKILSLYDSDAQVIKRGKAGAAVEFGNTLVLGEQRDGLIIDWQVEEEARGDSNLLLESCDRISSRGIQLQQVCADRGFSSEANETELNEREIVSYLMPRNMVELRKRMSQDDVRYQHRRRAQTEGRIGIFQSLFMNGGPLVRGLEARRHVVSWGVLAHNLWKVARQLREEALAREEELAAA